MLFRVSARFIACYGLLLFVPGLVHAQTRVARWHTTLDSATETASRTGKPLFIVFRCVPCGACWEWDGQVAHADKAIAELREQFVCARIPQMNDVDIQKFEHDFDTTWAAYFMDANGHIYSRFGGRDETDPEARLDGAALLQTMREVLEVHERRMKRGPTDTDEELQPAPATSSTPEDIPLLESRHTGCVHCHQVQEYRLRQSYLDGVFDQKALFGFPLPESIGLKFVRSHGHRLERVEANSLAERAGLKPGDLVTHINAVPIHSEQDVRWALHRSQDSKPVAVTVSRVKPEHADETIRVELTVSGNWRQTELGWRKSLRSVPLSLGFLGYPLDAEELRTGGLMDKNATAAPMALRVVSLRGEGLAQSLGLRKDDVIVALEDQRKHRTLDDFKSDLLRRYSPGDLVTVTVQRDGQPIVLKGALPDWSLDVNGLP